MEYILTLIIAAVLGLIPANIAKRKGHSFGLWWFYGWMLFIVAIIHVQFIEDYNAGASQRTTPTISQKQVQSKSSTEVAEELKSLKSLLDSGVITQAEFDAKKRQLLGL